MLPVDRASIYSAAHAARVSNASEIMVPVTRVEWSVLEGGQVETVLSNLIYNLDGRSIRIRPSQGDFGIDVIRPAEGDPNRWDVYQIKKFANNLEPGQKRQIIDSFARALVGMLRRGVPLHDWYVVLPLDPTLENYLDWLETVPDSAVDQLKKDKKLDPPLSDEEQATIKAWREVPGRVIGWKGLDFCGGAGSGVLVRRRLLPPRRRSAHQGRRGRGSQVAPDRHAVA